MSQSIDNPDYYRNNQSKIECIEITRYLSFCRGNAIKYLWRCGQKDTTDNELKKAIWYLKDELKNNNTVLYEMDVCLMLDNKLTTLSMYQDDNTRRLFWLIVFGHSQDLKTAIKIIEDMLV